MTAKVIFLDRVLANYGPETKEVRAIFRRSVEQVANSMWPQNGAGETQLDPSASRSEELFAAIQSLRPAGDLQTALKTQAATTSLELTQLRWLEYEQSAAALSMPMLCILVFWTAALFASFGLFAPRNGTVIVALFAAGLSVTGAIFLILELNSPFAGLLQIPQAGFLDAIAHLGK
jgi:hypothetical protein